MEITVNQSKILQTIAILMMLFLHLFNRSYDELFVPLIFIGKLPLSYYLSTFCDACVPIFCFVSGYGLFFTYNKNEATYKKNNLRRIFKLYINYWIILILFAVFLGLLLNKEGMPGSLTKFISNFLAVSNSYNGAWWFFFTYMLLIYSSNLIFKLVNKEVPFLLLFFALSFYLLAFYFRIYKPNLFENTFFNWIQEQVSLYGCSFLPFLIGVMSLKYKWNTKVSLLFDKIKPKSSVAILGIIILIVIHGIIPNFIIAPFIAVAFIFMFNQIKLSDNVVKWILKLSVHSTNLWLIHMFYYQIYFKDFIYSPKYVGLIFVLLIGCCVLSSYFINKLYKPILKLRILK